jgi:hypothetical protein
MQGLCLAIKHIQAKKTAAFEPFKNFGLPPQKARRFFWSFFLPAGFPGAKVGKFGKPVPMFAGLTNHPQFAGFRGIRNP